ncbi:hypothetical protein [Parasphingorhabdus sp.]|uniref:hypothetical protein n=1 Tax=Parasphingorhabdus sp. TaxID=2709688 RepID=UPI003263DAAA
MSWIVCLLLVGAQSLATPANAPVAVQASDAEVADMRDSALFRAAHKLADIHVGGTKMSSEVQATVRTQLKDQFSKMEDFQYLEGEYPGVTQVVVDAAVPIAIRQTEDTIPEFIDRLAAFFAKKMTLDEINDLTDWLTKPTIKRVRSSMDSNFDLGEIIEGSVADEDYQISADELERMTIKSAEQTVSKLSGEDIGMLVSFSKQESFKKYQSLKPQAMSIEAEWSNESTPAGEQELETAVTQAIENFTGLDLSGVE